MNSVISSFKIKKNLFIIGILLLVIILLKIIWAGIPSFRFWYAYHWYPSFSIFQRTVFGLIPFSVGEIIYFTIIILLLRWIILVIKNTWRIIKRKSNHLVILCLQAVSAVLLLYLIFLACWGFNYQVNRIRHVFNIQLQSYSVSELDSLCVYLARQVNSSHHAIAHNDTDSTTLHFSTKNIFATAIHYYNKASRINSFLRYYPPAVKSSMIGYLMNYTGIEGYYNPFTGEAQVNTTMPALLQPYVVCHEIAHQIGFASEYSASFTGYYIATQSHDARFIYSANFEMLIYAVDELRFRDSTSARNIWKDISPGVKKDYKAIQQFYHQFNNPVNPIMADLYDSYLKANRQKRGIKSYNQVVALLINYRREK